MLFLESVVLPHRHTQALVPPTPVSGTLVFLLFSLFFPPLQMRVKMGTDGAQGGAKRTKCAPKVSKMEAKGRSGPPLHRHPRGDPVKKGAMCNPYIICYVSSTSALPEKVTFSLQWAPQNEGKIGSTTEAAKKRHKSGATGAEEKQRGGTWGPKGGPGSPK